MVSSALSDSDVRKCLTGRQGTLFYGAGAKAVDYVIKRGKVVHKREGDIVFEAGDDAGWFYVLLTGNVVTQLNGVNVRPLVPGEVGGITSSLEPPGEPTGDGTHLKRSMTHRVTSPDGAQLLVVPFEVYRELLHDSDFAIHAVAYLHMRLRKKTAVISLLTGNAGDAAMTKPQRGDMRIAVFDTKPYDRAFLGAAFAPYADKDPRITLKFLEAKLSDATAGLAVGCQAVCIFVNDRCDKKVLLALRSAGVQLVLLRNAGFNNVDLKAAKQLGTTVMRVPAYSPNAVAEHAFALLATVNRKTNRAYNRVRDGNFTLAGFEGRDLKGLTAGVAGCGKIGQCFVRIARGCGMNVVVYDRKLPADVAKELGVEVIKDFEEFAKRCDVLSLHVPLTKDTKHLVNEKVLRSMPKGAIIINTSRGAIVDAKALVRALLDGHIGGAGLDVYEEETRYFFEDHSAQPIRDDTLSRLVNMPNVVVTSHQAFLTDKALGAIANTTLGNARAFQTAVLKGLSFDDLPNCLVAGSLSGKLERAAKASKL